jgi:hypothetical protein
MDEYAGKERTVFATFRANRLRTDSSDSQFAGIRFQWTTSLSKYGFSGPGLSLASCGLQMVARWTPPNERFYQGGEVARR